MNFFVLFLRSFRNRSLILSILVFSIGLGLFAYLSLERVKSSAEESFRRSVTGIDLIVGPRSGELELLLSSALLKRPARNAISAETWRYIESKSDVEWALPISLGDNHQGFPVIGTSPEFLEQFRYGRSQSLTFHEGSGFEEVLEIVIGSEVAKTFGYSLGDEIYLQHGLSADSFYEHEQSFRVVGVLEASKTVLDRALFVRLEAISYIHLGWEDGAPPTESDRNVEPNSLELPSLTAVYVKLKDRFASLKVQRELNQYTEEALSAIIPGVSFQELWVVVRSVNDILRLVLYVILFICLSSTLGLLWLSIDIRSREIAIYRALGAPKSFVFLMVLMEGVSIWVLSVSLALVAFFAPWNLWVKIVDEYFGVSLESGFLGLEELGILTLFLFACALGALIPALRIYWSDQLVERLKGRF